MTPSTASDFNSSGQLAPFSGWEWSANPHPHPRLPSLVLGILHRQPPMSARSGKAVNGLCRSPLDLQIWGLPMRLYPFLFLARGRRN